MRACVLSVDPWIVDWLAVGRMVWPGCQELEPIGTGFERARDFRRDTNRVARPHLENLIVELDLARASQDHVDLLCVSVAVSKG